MKTAAKTNLLRRVAKVVVVLALLLVATVTVTWFTMRDRIADKVLDTVETRLAAKGLFLHRSSHRISWSEGLILNDLSLFDDPSKQRSIATITRVGIRIPLRDLIRKNPRLVVRAKKGGLEIDSPAGALRLEDLDTSFEVAGEALEIGHFEALVHGLRVTAAGALRWKEGEGSGLFKIPDLSPIVKAASWLECPEGEPTLALQLTPRDAPEGGLDLDAEFTGEKFRWKTLPLDRARARIALADGAVELSPLSLDGFGGSLEGGLTIDYRKERLTIAKVRSTMDPFGFVASLPLQVSVGEAMKRFRAPGAITVEGQGITFDLGEFARSTATFEVDAPGGISVVHKSGAIPLREFRGEVRLGEGALGIDAREFVLSGGKGSGAFSMPLSGPFRHQVKFAVDGASLAQLGPVLGLKGDPVGSVSHTFEGGGASGLRSLHGAGRVKITEGRFYTVPIFGSLRTFLVGQAPPFGQDVAEDLEATYTIKDGTIQSPDLRVESTATVVTMEGGIDFNDNTVAATARANLKGIIGVATSLPSKILEVRGEGPIDDVDWRLAHVPEVAGEAAQVVGEAAQVAVEGVGDAAKATGKAVEKVGEAVEDVGEAAAKLLERRPRPLVPKKED